MQSALITSLQNPLVKQIRKLHRTKDRHRQGLFLLEGTHLLQEACAVSYPLQTVCCTPVWQARHANLWLQIEQRASAYRLVSAEVLAAMSTTVNPDGVIAIAPRRQLPPPETVSLGVALEQLQDPGNVGTIIRAAAAAGADGLWLSQDSADADHPKTLRASAGQWFRLPLIVPEALPEALQQLRQQSIQIVATTPVAALDYWALDLRLPTVFLLGNEGAGLSAELMALATHQVKIPLAAGVESLNVAIAAALLLYEARRQRGSTAH
ncbi:MAG: RNA methyltransferase [Leptolyngbya sp. SIO4C1]|nr:RNA methyltransferase [Leptolyngbya sp. SIO4C1]